MEFQNKEEIYSKVRLGIFNKEEAFYDFSKIPIIDRNSFVLCPIVINDTNYVEQNPTVNMADSEFINKFGLNDKEILDFAIKNSTEHYPGIVKTVMDFVDNPPSMIPDGIVMPQIYVITNEDLFHGAAALIYQPQLLENIANLTNKDIAIFLTDKNCVHCIPVSDSEQVLEYQEIYRNAMEGIENILSADVLHYDAKNKLIKDLGGNVIETIRVQQIENKTHLRR